VLGVPLIYRGRVNGILTLHHETANFFHKGHLTLATGIAGQAAVAIENASLFTQVKQEQEALYALLRGLPIPVLVIAAGQLIFRNQAAERELQVQQLNVPLTTLSGGSSLQSILTEAGQSKKLHSSEVNWPDGRIFNVSLNKVAQHGTVIAFSDVTHLKALAAMKTQFVETVSHDLKNPISLVKGFAKLLEFEELSEQGQINLEQIIRSATHMETLIENLLELAQIEAGVEGQVKSCDMAEIIQTVLDEYKFQLNERQMTLIRVVPLGLGNVLGDPVRLAEVVANLVSNAIKYTPQQGRIMVSLARTGAEIYFQVTDTGRGIPPEARPQLFQKFYRVPIKDDVDWVEGTGLGLSIVKAIVEDYGGRVWVESELGVGSTFGCALPVSGGSL
jgi:signal transduction histidine kinase